MNKLKIHEKYAPLFDKELRKKVRYFVVTGGRGSGKSFAVSLANVQSLMEFKQKILFTRWTMKSADVSIIPEFVEKIDLLGVDQHFRVSKDEVNCFAQRSGIIFRGIKTSAGNQTAALKSLSGLTGWVLDEAEELVDESIFSKIDMSIRSQNNPNFVILILNPATKDHWIFKRFFKDKVEPGFNGVVGNVCYIHSTWEDNRDNLPDEFIQELVRMKFEDPVRYKHEIMGGWKERADGLVFPEFSVGNFRPTNNMCYGQDFGFSDDPTVLVHVSVDEPNRKLYAKEVFRGFGMSASSIAKNNLKSAGSGLIMADSADPRLVAELKKYGCNIRKVTKKHGSIIDGIALMQDFDIVLDPGSKEMINEFSNYAWHQSNRRPIDKYNHTPDAIRYALTRLYARKRTGKYILR